MKNVLVIGGSLFAGRVFSIYASRNGGFELHVVNRGNYPMDLDRVNQYKCDRHSPRMIARLVPDIKFDALVDFCAYEPGEIKPVIEALGSRIGQYVFFSTASVCVPGDGFLDENAPMLEMPADDSDAVSAYIRKKIELERELADACAKSGINYTILRPTFIYGPFNYAPRETYFIKLIAKQGVVPIPVDAGARFNFVYVIDVAQALMACIGDSRAYNGVFNLAGPEVMTYSKLISEFERNSSRPIAKREVTVAQADAENIPFPFPLTGDSLVNGEKFARTFDFAYTPIAEGMEKTFSVFYNIFSS